MNKQIAKEMLFKVVNILDKYHIEYFLSLGTLLGAYRDRDFIDNDNDIDLGVFYPFYFDFNLYTQFFNELKEVGIRCDSLCGKNVMHLEYKEVGMDLYTYHFEESHKFYYLLAHELHLYTQNSIVPLKKISFLDRDFACPNNIEEYLELEYGFDWKTPLDIKGGGKNVIYFKDGEDSKCNFYVIGVYNMHDAILDDKFNFTSKDIFKSKWENREK